MNSLERVYSHWIGAVPVDVGQPGAFAAYSPQSEQQVDENHSYPWHFDGTGWTGRSTKYQQNEPTMEVGVLPGRVILLGERLWTPFDQVETVRAVDSALLLQINRQADLEAGSDAHFD